MDVSIEKSHKDTESRLNEVTFNVSTQTIYGYLKNPYKDEFNKIEFEVSLLVTEDVDIEEYLNTSQEEKKPQYLFTQLIEMFKQNIMEVH